MQLIYTTSKYQDVFLFTVAYDMDDAVYQYEHILIRPADFDWYFKMFMAVKGGDAFYERDDVSEFLKRIDTEHPFFDDIEPFYRSHPRQYYYMPGILKSIVYYNNSERHEVGVINDAGTKWLLPPDNNF